jgi:hypothetical protein
MVWAECRNFYVEEGDTHILTCISRVKLGMILVR